METYSTTNSTTPSSLLLSYHGFLQQQKQNVTRAHKMLCNKHPCNLMDLHHLAGVTSTSPPLGMMKPLEDLTNFEIEDLLDFPTEEEGEEGGEERDAEGEGEEEEEDGGEAPHSFVSELNSKSRNCAGVKSSKLQEEGLSIPPDELVDELEWLSTFNEDNSYSGDTHLASLVSSEGHAPTYNTKSTSTPLRDTYMRSPVSVLEQIGHHHFSYIRTHLENPKRSRKARSRGRIWSRDILKPIPMNKSVSQDNTMCSTASNDDDAFNTSSSLQQWEIIGRPPLKKKPKKARLTCVDIEDSDSTIVVRRCSHCLVHKTPQWRAGPLGPKTLCNACGVRFKSGRLLPEYRPACSPTFVTHVHSNSHRRILEMRRAREELGSQCNKKLEIAHEDDCSSWNGSWKASSSSQDMSLLHSSKDVSQEAKPNSQEMEVDECTDEFNVNHILIRVLDKKSMYKKGSIVDEEEEEVTMSWDGSHVNETPQAIHKKGHVIHDSIAR